MTPIYYPPTQNGLQKTLDANLDTGTTASLTLNNTTGVQNKPGMIVIDRIDTNGNEQSASLREYISFTGTSGATLTGLTRGLGGSSDQDHSTGAVVEFVPDVVWAQMIADALALVVDSSDISAVNSTNVVSPSATDASGYGFVLDEDDLASDSATKLATQQSIKAYVDSSASSDGWIQYSAVTPTRASADDPTYVLTFAGVDLTSTMYVGQKVKLTQSTDKFFIITAISFSTDTTMTLYGGTDYDVADTGTTAISAFYYSTSKAPAAFPLDPTKWTVTTSDTTNRTQSSPVDGTWYNPGTITHSIPIGIWNTSYQAALRVQSVTGTANRVSRGYITLSTANNSESDSDLTAEAYTFYYVSSDLAETTQTMFRQKVLSISSKTSYYLNVQSKMGANGAAINIQGAETPTIIRSVCAYL